jgi:CRP/FNR family cyclic AMP-dependent transcriptional regulator
MADSNIFAESNDGHQFESFLETISRGKQLLRLPRNHALYTQGDSAGALFYLHTGKVKLVTVSFAGKEATLAVVGAKDFFGLSSLGASTRYLDTAITLESSLVSRIEWTALIRELHQHRNMYDLFFARLLNHTRDLQKELCAQIFDSSEKRLARTLLKLSQLDHEHREARIIPRVSHEVLATMVGTTRPRVSYFMNKFRRLGFITYGRRVVVHASKLSNALVEWSSP